MVDPNPHELAAMSAAADAGGEYLDSIGKTDLARLSEEEWSRFIAAVCGGYVDRIAVLQAEVNEAFQRATVR